MLKKGKSTISLILINIIIFIIMSMNGNTLETNTLLKYGAMQNILVFNGQYWRLFTAMFIHIGIMHLIMNMFFLYTVGDIFEFIYGPKNFLILYLLTGIFGNIFTYTFGDSTTVSAGASTALYGLFGLALGIRKVYKDNPVLNKFGSSFVTIIIINVVYSLISPGVSILGHLGGLIGGYILAHTIPVNNMSIKKETKDLYSAIFAISIIAGLVVGRAVILQ